MQYTVYAAAKLPARALGVRDIYLYNNTYVLKMLSKNFINTDRIIYFFLLFMYNLKSIRYCKYGDADAGGWYTERSASQNGMLLKDHFEAVFVKNNSRQGMNFRWKFNHFMCFRAFRSDIFLTLRLLQNNLEAYPFCSELRLSVYQLPASAISQ